MILKPIIFIEFLCISIIFARYISSDNNISGEAETKLTNDNITGEQRQLIREKRFLNLYDTVYDSFPDYDDYGVDENDVSDDDDSSVPVVAEYFQPIFQETTIERTKKPLFVPNLFG